MPPMVARQHCSRILSRNVIFLRLAKQTPETLLLKIMIVSEHVGELFTAHRLHQYAIDHTVTLVGPRVVKFKAFNKRSVGLLNDAYAPGQLTQLRRWL